MSITILKPSETRRSRFILVTIVRNGNAFVTLEELMNSLKILKGQLVKYGTEWSDNVAYEMKKNSVLHLHTICSCQRAPFYKSPIGWNIQLKTIRHLRDVPHVISYINKCKNQYDGDILQLERASYIYTSPNIFIEEGV